MPEITRKRTGELLRIVFKYLLDKPEGRPAKEILAHIPQATTLSEYESGYYQSTPGSPRFEKIVRFATIDTVKAGWIVKSKGVWSMTEEGLKAYEKHKDPEEFYREAIRLYQLWNKSRPQPEELLNDEEAVQETSITLEEAEEKSWIQIQHFLQNIPPYEFQELAADLLRAMDYHVVWVAPRGRDQGIDIIAYNDPLGASIPRIKVQVKHREQATAVGELRSFLSVLGTDDLGIFLSSGGFTSEAKEEARTQERRKVTLIDLENFYDLWVEHYDKLPQEAQQRFPLRPIYFLSPIND